MIRRRRERGGFPLSELMISAVLIVLCVFAFIFLGRLGWSWWVRLLAIIGGLYALNGILFLGLALRERAKESRGP